VFKAKSLPLSCAESLKILGTSNSWSPRGLPRSVKGDRFTTFLAMKDMDQHSRVTDISDNRNSCVDFVCKKVYITAQKDLIFTFILKKN
jgi:hypothetical protein